MAGLNSLDFTVALFNQNPATDYGSIISYALMKCKLPVVCVSRRYVIEHAFEEIPQLASLSQRQIVMLVD